MVFTKRAIAAMALLPLSALAQQNGEAVVGDPVAGKQKASEVCAACHGMDGDAIVPEYPDLAGQNAPYLISALKAYKLNRRTGGNAGIMAPQANNLTEQDMADLAAYYSSLGSDDAVTED